MTVFRLKAKHLTGVAQIVDEHAQLVRITDLLRRQMIVPDGLQSVRETFGILEQHTRVHFANEERAMERHGYPDFYAHRAVHRNLLVQLEGMLRKLEPQRSFAAKSLNTSLAIWLLAHIAAEDVKLGRFLLAQPGAETAVAWPPLIA